MKRVNSELKYHCKIFDVFEEEFILPDGKKTKQSHIEHKPTVAVVAINDNNELLLINQYRNAVKTNLLEIPAGSMDKQEESPVLCAQRELAEETGFQARTFIKLFGGFLLPGYCNEYMHFFLARDIYSDPLPPDCDEFIEVVPTSFARAHDLVQKGEIIDAKTVLGIMLAEDYVTKSRTNFSNTSL